MKCLKISPGSKSKNLLRDLIVCLKCAGKGTRLEGSRVVGRGGREDGGWGRGGSKSALEYMGQSVESVEFRDRFIHIVARIWSYVLVELSIVKRV